MRARWARPAGGFAVALALLAATFTPTTGAALPAPDERAAIATLRASTDDLGRAIITSAQALWDLEAAAQRPHDTAALRAALASAPSLVPVLRQAGRVAHDTAVAVAALGLPGLLRLVDVDPVVGASVFQLPPQLAFLGPFLPFLAQVAPYIQQVAGVLGPLGPILGPAVTELDRNVSPLLVGPLYDALGSVAPHLAPLLGPTCSTLLAPVDLLSIGLSIASLALPFSPPTLLSIPVGVPSVVCNSGNLGPPPGGVPETEIPPVSEVASPAAAPTGAPSLPVAAAAPVAAPPAPAPTPTGEVTPPAGPPTASAARQEAPVAPPITPVTERSGLADAGSGGIAALGLVALAAYAVMRRFSETPVGVERQG